jgi:hypothetical protein
MQVVTILLPVIFAFVLMSVKLFNSYRRAVRDHLLDRFYSSEPCHEPEKAESEAGVHACPAKRNPAEWFRRGCATSGVSDCPEKARRIYLSELLIEVKFVLRFAPRPLTTAMMASAMPAAIRPYSIAVAPPSSRRKLNKVRFKTASHFKPPFRPAEPKIDNLKLN